MSSVASVCGAVRSKLIMYNSLATAHTVRAFLPAMLADTKEIRQIVVPMSPVAFFNWPAATMYSANRAGLLGFTKALQQDMYGSVRHGGEKVKKS